MTGYSLTGKHWTITKDFRGQGSHALLHDLVKDRGLNSSTCITLPMEVAEAQPPDLPKAMERMRSAVASGEKIGIFGDYDADGITAVVLILRYFHRRGMKPTVYLPHRQQEGYGLKESSLRTLLAQGITLLLTVDTGVSSAQELQMACDAGVDVIVVDHHHLPEMLPNAVAILHPELARGTVAPASAAGVAFGLVSALEDGTWKGRDEDLALAAIGTVADLVELKGENRNLVAAGLTSLTTLQGGPLPLLLRQSGITGAPTSRDIAFRIAPRLNAAGRMADPRVALEALLGDPEALVQLETFNRERQSLTQEILRELEKTAAATPSFFLTVSSPDYPAGILGLIAGKLTESLGRPSMAAQVQGDVCVASLRSIPGFHVTEALTSVADLLTSFGGHAQAAGCTFPHTALPELQERLNAHAESLLTPQDLVPRLSIDGILDPADVTLELCNALQTLEPFGQGNPEPRFLLPGVRFSTLKRIGREFAHLQGSIGHLKAVGFRLSSIFEKIPTHCDVACRIGIDTWNGNNRPQIFIEDVRPAVSAFFEPDQQEAPNLKLQAP